MARKKPPISEAPTPLSSLADALRARGVQVAEASNAVGTATPAVKLPRDGAPDLSRSGKLVVRRERKGHGGKTVTVIEGLRLSSTQLEMMARTLRKTLGAAHGWRTDVCCCRAIVPATEKWLRARGQRRSYKDNDRDRGARPLCVRPVRIPP
jgi:translation initiation factor 1 (eIF-1/SUI1)